MPAFFMPDKETQTFRRAELAPLATSNQPSKLGSTTAGEAFLVAWLDVARIRAAFRLVCC